MKTQKKCKDCKYLEKCKLDGNSEATLSNKQTRIRNFIIDSNFDSINKYSLKEYLNRRKKRWVKLRMSLI